MSIVETMIATGILTIAGLGLMSLSNISSHDSIKLKIVRSLLNSSSKIDASLKNPSSWKKTISKNSSFDCLKTAQGCSVATSSTGYYDFVIYGLVNNEKVTYDPSDSTSAMTLNGLPCNGASYCPLKYVAKWKPVCATYPCLNPEIDISVTPQLDSAMSLFVNDIQRYKYELTRGTSDGSIQSACLLLNGIYNSSTGKCEPKHAGKTCVSIGKPGQIIDSVDINGNITCKPLYSGQCNPNTQVMTGVNANGVAQCGARSQPSSCPINCVGGWSGCSASCGGGIQTYQVITPAQNGGAACTTPAIGSTQACNTQACPTNCQGHFSSCSQSCGGGTMTYLITKNASNGGASCPYSAGATLTCNTQSCAVAVNCAGYWTNCNATTGTQNFIVTQLPQNGGTACPSVTTQNCAVNCSGSWGACNNGYKTYSWTTTPKNGGSSCPYSNGQTDSTGCAQVINCQGSWGSCDTSGVKTYTITQFAQNGGAACPYSNGQTDSSGCAQPVNCQGYWGACNQAAGTRDYVITQQPANGGAACPSPTTQPCQKTCNSAYLVSLYGNPVYIQCSTGNPSSINFSLGGSYTCFSWTGSGGCRNGPFSFNLSNGGSFTAQNSHGVQGGTITSLGYCSVTVAFKGGISGQSTINFCY